MDIKRIISDLKRTDIESSWVYYKDDLIEKIYKDFPYQNILLREELAVDFLSNNDEERIFLEYHLYGMTWQELIENAQTVYDMNYNVGFLSHKAFVYYLPAYLIIALKEFKESPDYVEVGCDEVITLLFFGMDFLEKNWDQLNNDQKIDIIIFLILFLKNPYYSFNETDAKDIYNFLSSVHVEVS